MADSYQGTTDEHFDRLIDELSIVCADDDSTTLGQFYERLPVPADLIC